MPVMDGYEATEMIRRLQIHQKQDRTPIVAITANAMAGDRERYIAAGMDGYVSKPIDRQVLYDEIVKVVSQRLNA